MLINRFLSLGRRLNYKILQQNNNFRLVTSNVSHSATTAPKDKEIDDLDTPVKFTSSPARQWKASTSRTGYVQQRLWYEPYVILASLSVFLIYFTILREENDIDEELKKSLYSRIEGLEEHQLRQSLEYNREHNLDTSQIIQRLEELEREKANKM